ncbi:hypothetical protein [Paractinoplanes rishiriensis]|nr:hypothetical protein [Actinoplanes rishiriensis]
MTIAGWSRRRSRRGEITLRPFTEGDIPWVYAVSHDPEVQRFVQIPQAY